MAVGATVIFQFTKWKMMVGVTSFAMFSFVFVLKENNQVLIYTPVMGKILTVLRKQSNCFISRN